MKKFCYCITFLGILAILTTIAFNKDLIFDSFVATDLSTSISMKNDENLSKKIVDEIIGEDEKGINLNQFLSMKLDITPASLQKTPIEIYDSMSIAEREDALQSGTLHMEYSGLYTYSNERLSTSKGAQYYNGHKETYYSQKVLPGTSLNIPGRHVAEDGTVRDENGFICVAADPGFMPKGSILITSLGPAKVYDCGCAYGIIDIYVNW